MTVIEFTKKIALAAQQHNDISIGIYQYDTKPFYSGDVNELGKYYLKETVSLNASEVDIIPFVDDKFIMQFSPNHIYLIQDSEEYTISSQLQNFKFTGI